jgi:two-component system nitrate/nitrite response regulator NarL
MRSYRISGLPTRCWPILSSKEMDACRSSHSAARTLAPPACSRPVEQGFDQLVEENLDALLTPREIEVLSAVGEGLGNKAIARKLDISLHTVKFHLEAIFRKLGVRSRAEAVAKGLTRVNL